MTSPAETQRSYSEALPEPGPYENYIRGLLPHWSHLRIVTDFMSADLKDTPIPLTGRISETNVRVVDIEYINPGRISLLVTVKDQHFDDITEFQRFLGQSRTRGSKAMISRFLMVQGLSTKLIETLGSTFNIDPEFFAQHLGEWSRHYREGFSDSPEEAGYVPYLLKSNIQEQEFQHFAFRRAYEWQEEEWIKKTNLTNSNLWRSHVSEGIKPHVFVNERFSFLSLYDSGDFTGICLSDPLPHLPAFRVHGAIRNYRRKPFFSGAGGRIQSQSELPPRVSGQKMLQPTDSIFSSPVESGPSSYFYKSLRDETVDDILNMSQTSLKNISFGRNHILMCLTMRIILSSWALVASILNRKMEELEEGVPIDAGGDISGIDIPACFIKLRKYARNFAGDLERTLFILDNSLELGPTIREDTEQLFLEFTKMANRGNIGAPRFHVRGTAEKTQGKSVQMEVSMGRLVILVTLVAGILSTWSWMKHWIFVGLSLLILTIIHSISEQFKGLRLHLTWNRVEKEPVMR